VIFFFSSRRRHTRSKRDWSSDVCSSDLLKFNGVKKNWLVIGRNRRKAPFAAINRSLITVPGMDGGYLSRSRSDALIIEQPIFYYSDSDTHALNLKDELAEWLYTREPAPLEFEDEPWRVYYAFVQNTLADFAKID